MASRLSELSTDAERETRDDPVAVIRPSFPHIIRRWTKRMVTKSRKRVEWSGHLFVVNNSSGDTE